MELFEAVKARHSVRSYTSRPLEPEIIQALQAETDACNREGGLHIQLVTEEPAAFQGFLPHYGKFSGVRNYLALVGPKGPELDEKIGYYGERLVLKAQMLGLNTCWVALTFRRGRCAIQRNPGEKLFCVIALGYGATQGVPHRSKPLDFLCRAETPVPDWFLRGMESAILAPTATNQQKFFFIQSASTVQAKATGGFYPGIDLGIVKYHFEIGAGTSHFTWA